MDVRIVDTEVVRQNIKDLKTLKKECQQEREKKLGEFSADQGEVHDELEKRVKYWMIRGSSLLN